MTNLEALQSLSNLEAPNLHEKILLDNAVNPTDDYTSENKDIIELCSAYVYKAELTHPDFSEGKLRIAVNSKALKSLMNAIFKKNNLPEEMVILKAKIQFETL